MPATTKRKDDRERFDNAMVLIYKELFDYFTVPELIKAIEKCVEDYCKGGRYVKAFLSPLHDMDNCKDHYHIALHFNKHITKEDVEELLAPIFIEDENGRRIGLPEVELWHNFVDALRYLVHLSQRNKHQYDINDCYGFNGESIFDYIKFRNSEITRAEKKINAIIKDKKIAYIWDLEEELEKNPFLDHIYHKSAVSTRINAKMQQLQGRTAFEAICNVIVDSRRRILSKQNDTISTHNDTNNVLKELKEAVVAEAQSVAVQTKEKTEGTKVNVALLNLFLAMYADYSDYCDTKQQVTPERWLLLSRNPEEICETEIKYGYKGRHKDFALEWTKYCETRSDVAF